MKKFLLLLIAGLTMALPASAKWKLVTDLNEVSAGTKVVIACVDEGIAMSTTQNKNNRGTTSVKITNGTIETMPNDAEVFTLGTASKGGWTFQTANGYLIANGVGNKDNNQNYLHTVASPTNEQHVADITNNNGVLSITFRNTNSNGGKYLLLNGNIWSAYVKNTSSYGKPSLFVEESGGDPSLKDAGLSFPQAQYSANLGEDFKEPTLTKATDAAAVYLSTVESVATVDPSTGVITLVAAGTTTIKANTDATATYKAGEASYTLTVNDPNAIKAQVVMANQNLDKNKYGKDKTVNWVSEDKKYTFVTSATVGPDKKTYPQYNSNNNPKGLRIYSSNGNVMTVNAPAGYKFVSAKATGSAGLKYNGSKTVTSSGTEIALNNATSFTFESGISSTMAITRFDFVLASDNPVVPDPELIAPVLTFSVPEGNYDPEGEAFNVEIKLNSDCYPKPEKIYYTINGKRAHAETAEGATEHRTVYKDPISVSVADAQAATGNKHAKAMTINAYAANVAGESVVAATYTFGKRTVTEGTEVETPEELFLVMNNNVADSNNELAAPFEYKGEVNGKHTYELDIQTANEHGIRGQFYVRDGKANKEGTFFGPHSQYQTYTPTVQAGSMMKAVTTNHPAYVPIEFTGGNSPVYDMAFRPENASQTTEHINFGTENPEKEQQGIASGKVIVTYEPGKKNQSAYMTLQLTGSVITGIENVAVDGSEAPVRYYNLQGVQLPAAPAAGFYLEVQGSRATKRLAR